MLKKTEGLAWLVLTLSFFACVALAVGAPVATRRYVLNSTRPLTIVLERRQGTVTLQAPGSSSALVVGSTMEIEPRSRIQGDSDADALLLFYHQDQPDSPIATIQLYGKTDLVVSSARTPRFSASTLPHRIHVQITQALNMHPSVFGNGRETELTVETPQGSVRLEEGAFRLEVEQQQTALIVNAGRAAVTDPATGESLVLVPLQRTEITADGVGEIYVGARDLLGNRNGNFEAPLEGTWSIYRDWFDESEDGGSVLQAQVGDEKIVTFERAGVSHAETGIRQEINQDIREAKSLRIRARVRISTQTLSVCGSVGTECPIMIRIYYVDQESGSVREWLQGFYFMEGDNEPFCQICRDWKPEQIKIPQDVWYDYESPDLIPLLREQKTVPAAIQSIEIYASGWTYGSAIDDIAILVGD